MYTYGGIENVFYTVRQKIIMQAKKYPKLKSKKKMQIIRDSFNECNITKAICDKDYKYFSKLNTVDGLICIGKFSRLEIKSFINICSNIVFLDLEVDEFNITSLSMDF